MLQARAADGRKSVTNSQQIGIYPAPPGAPIGARRIAGCFQLLRPEEKSCVIFLQKPALSSDWRPVRLLSTWVCLQVKRRRARGEPA